MKRRARWALWAALALAIGAWMWRTLPMGPSDAPPPVAYDGAGDDPVAVAGDPGRPSDRSRIEAIPTPGGDLPAVTRATEVLTEDRRFPSQRFRAEAYDMGRMQIFGEFWRTAEREWDAARYRLAEAEADYLDGQQSYQVYVYLRTCLDAPRTPSDGDRHLQRIEEAVEQSERLRDPEYLARILERVDRSLVRCDGLEGDLEPAAMGWLTRAAERGYPLAQIAFYRSYRWLAARKPYLIFSNPDAVYGYLSLAPGFLRAALESGHAEAFVENARAYHEGVVFRRDPELAYAYAVAAAEAGEPDLQVGRQLRGVLAEELDPVQLRKARERARELCDTYCL